MRDGIEGGGARGGRQARFVRENERGFCEIGTSSLIASPDNISNIAMVSTIMLSVINFGTHALLSS